MSDVETETSNPPVRGKKNGRSRETVEESTHTMRCVCALCFAERLAIATKP